jgi:uncharacterized protein
MNHLRYADRPFEEQRVAFLDIIRADHLVHAALVKARSLDLPDWLVVSGALYNAVWNSLAGKPCGFGTKDIDLFYFDGADLSYEAEDAVIARAAVHFDGLPLPVEVRNQARVHLWFEQRFGQPYPRLQSSADALTRFASRTHAVGVRLHDDDSLDLTAPFGLDDIFSFRVAPNRAIDNRATHEEKAARAKRQWPEITVIPW